MKCSVISCKNKIKFKFPSNPLIKKRWLEIIERPTFKPRLSHGLCIEHFNPEDIITESYRDGYKLQNIRLKKGALPTKVPWQSENVKKNVQTEAVLEKEYSFKEKRLQSNTSEGSEQFPNCEDIVGNFDSNESSSKPFNSSLDVYKIDVDNAVSHSEILKSQNSNLDIECNSDDYEEVCSDVNMQASQPSDYCQNRNQRSISSQTYTTPRYTITDFKNKPKSLIHFTGLENYEKFLTVLYLLGPAVYHLKYVRSTVGNLDIPDQLFLVLWKLRRYPSDMELAEHFNVPQIAVGNIFITWIIFMAKTWSLIDIWPSRELINFYMPETFKRNYPTARVIVDGTEIKTEASSNPRQKQSSFSTYKNAPTMKVLVNASPGGLISYCSPAYGGSTSDRQIVERSDLCKKCQSGDTVIEDKGFLVQDIFAPYNVTIATPTPLVTGSIPHKIIMKDRKLSKHRVHIERVIGLLKTFTILSKKLNHYYVPLTSEIVGVCVMLTNFKENIMSD